MGNISMHCFLKFDDWQHQSWITAIAVFINHESKDIFLDFRFHLFFKHIFKIDTGNCNVLSTITFPGL